MALKDFIHRLLARQEGNEDFFTQDVQIQIAKDEALKSAIGLCVLQQGLLRGLIESLAEMEIGVGLDEELAKEIERLVNSLHASYDLAGEIVGFDEIVEKESE